MMDKVSLVRSVYHTAAAVHDTGHQMMQTGRLFAGGTEHPPYGSVLAKLKGSRHDTPPYVLLPKPIGPTGGNLPHGHAAGYLGKTFDPFILNADPNDKAFKVPDLLPPDYVTAVRESRRRSLRVGDRRRRRRVRVVGRRPAARCQLRRRVQADVEPPGARGVRARRRAGRGPRPIRPHPVRTELPAGPPPDRAGVRFVTVNMFETVFNEITWDIHGSAPFSPIECYKNEVGPNFDNAYTALLEDLERRGMLETTMVLAFGEFGRTPKINPAGGRDHHPACWTVLFAGGPIQGGRVVGASDEIGYAPKDRPVTTAEIAATVYQGLGIDPATELPGPQSRPLRLVDHGVEPIEELF